MKIMVTGGAGYIGSVATAELIAAGHSVVVLDNLYQGHRAAVHPDAAFVQADLNDAAAVDAAFTTNPGIDGVMHFASYTLVGESMQQPMKYLRDNQVAGCNLIEAANAHGIGRFIFSSTANLFDEPESMPIEPDNKIVPGSPYGESKFFLERTLHWYNRIYGMKYACLRYFNASGGTPGRGEDHTPEYHIIPIILEVALGKRERVTVFGDDYATPDGTCIRDYIHVVDLASAHIKVMEQLDALGVRKYNLGNGNGFSVLQLIEAAEQVTGREVPYSVGPRRAGDPAVLVASSAKIRDELGWIPRYDTIEKIIASAWEWHLNHPNGYDDK